jgi:hypothetical protein
MGGWSGPSYDEWKRKWAMPALDMGMIDPSSARRLFGMDLLDHEGGVHIVLVDIDTVRRRQAEMDELLGD